jgi:hypothetical protein
MEQLKFECGMYFPYPSPSAISSFPGHVAFLNILNVIVQGTCYEVELLFRLKGCLPRGTVCDCYPNVAGFSKLWLPRSFDPTVGASDVK